MGKYKSLAEMCVIRSILKEEISAEEMVQKIRDVAKPHPRADLPNSAEEVLDASKKADADVMGLATSDSQLIALGELAIEENARMRPVYAAAADVVSKFNAWTTTPEGMIDDATMNAIDALCAAVGKAEKGV